LKRNIIQTSDGSVTINLPDWGESYHSKHGAIQEAYHVYIKNGLHAVDKSHINILEIGFGTGLNAFITFLEAEKNKKTIDYVALEAFPVTTKEINQLNYVSQLNAIDFQTVFDNLHQSDWNEKIKLAPNFSMNKRLQKFETLDDKNAFDVIYFDAFGFRVQPELWTAAIFKSMYDSLLPNGILVTYAARGEIKRNMQAAGFMVEKLAGAPGKREMFRARKE
jgi:tRNA U34 5-methylaminomethyl-2-thiouridine-forming methyltransferase MnmC